MHVFRYSKRPGTLAVIPIQQLRIEFFSFQVLYVYISYQLPQLFFIIVMYRP